MTLFVLEDCATTWARVICMARTVIWGHCILWIKTKVKGHVWF